METAIKILEWCAVFNLLVLLGWFAALAFARDYVYGKHARWFKMTREQFDLVHYCAMSFYKLLLCFFNLAPLAALLALR